MKKYILITFLSVVLCQGILFAKTDPNADTKSQVSPDEQLLKAIEALDPNAIKTALDAGANPNLKFYTGDGKLVVCNVVMRFREKEKDCLIVLNHLFNAGAKLQPYDGEGEALFWSIANGFPSITEFLIMKGADPTRQFEGGLPLERAYAYGNSKIVDILIRHGATPRSERKVAELRFIELANGTEENCLLKMEEALNKGANINASNREGENAINNVASCAMVFPSHAYNILKYLIKKGIDVNSKAKMGTTEQTTALHTAIYSTHFCFGSNLSNARIEEMRWWSRQFLEAIIEAGAHVSARDGTGRTPLHIATKYNNLVGAEVLIKAGAKIMDRDDAGKTPLDYAESTEMIKLLKSHGATEQ